MNLEDLLKGGGLGQVASMVAQNPQLLNAAISLLNPKDASVGGTAGLGGLVSMFQQKGLGDIVNSWIGGGPNQPVNGAQVADALGNDTIGQFAQKAGINMGDAAGALAGLLPALVNQMTPQGQVPEGNGLESALGGLLGMLGQK
jgi:uncharacterized protein YidB (DUF937 family)